MDVISDTLPQLSEAEKWETVQSVIVSAARETLPASNGGKRKRFVTPKMLKQAQALRLEEHQKLQDLLLKLHQENELTEEERLDISEEALQSGKALSTKKGVVRSIWSEIRATRKTRLRASPVKRHHVDSGESLDQKQRDLVR